MNPLQSENERLRKALTSARNMLKNCGVLFDPDAMAQIDAALAVPAATATEPPAFESLAHMETLDLGDPAAATVEREAEPTQADYQCAHECLEAVRRSVSDQACVPYIIARHVRARLQSLEQTAEGLAKALEEAAEQFDAIDTIVSMHAAEPEVKLACDQAEGSAKHIRGIVSCYRTAQPVAAQREGS
jgi:hypothetical protein